MCVLNGKIINIIHMWVLYWIQKKLSILRYVYVILNSKKYKYSACIFIQYKNISRD